MKDFVNTAIEKAEHHAKNVLNTIPSLYNELVCYNATFKKWRTTCLWIEISEMPYYITYEHESKQILIKEKNCHGKILLRFDDNVCNDDISESIEFLALKSVKYF